MRVACKYVTRSTQMDAPFPSYPSQVWRTVFWLWDLRRDVKLDNDLSLSVRKKVARRIYYIMDRILRFARFIFARQRLSIDSSVRYLCIFARPLLWIHSSSIQVAPRLFRISWICGRISTIICLKSIFVDTCREWANSMSMPWRRGWLAKEFGSFLNTRNRIRTNRGTTTSTDILMLWFLQADTFRWCEYLGVRCPCCCPLSRQYFPL